MNTIEIKNVLEAALLCSPEPLSMIQLRKLFNDEFNAELLRPLLDELALDWDDRSVELASVASGWRFQSKPQYAMFINRLSPEKAPKYSRAVMETLAIIAYRQPVTRGDIEEIRGVSVGSQIIKTLEDRGWIDVIGHKEVPGRPALFATTRQFLDDLNLLSIKELPPIDEMGGEESVDFFAQQVSEAIEADGGSGPEPDTEDDAAPQLAESVARTGDLPTPHSDMDDTVPNLVSGINADAKPIADTSLESESSPDPAGSDQGGPDVPAATAMAAVGELAPDTDTAAPSNDTAPVAADGQSRLDEPSVLEAPEAPEVLEVETSVASDDESIDSTELMSADAAAAGITSDGDFLAAAAAEAVAALSEGDAVTGDQSVSVRDGLVDRSSEEPVEAAPLTAAPSALKPTGPAVDDPNLERVDWPELPSLDGLDDTTQESSEQTSEQDPPGGESEPVESR